MEGVQEMIPVCRPMVIQQHLMFQCLAKIVACGEATVYAKHNVSELRDSPYVCSEQVSSVAVADGLLSVYLRHAPVGHLNDFVVEKTTGVKYESCAVLLRIEEMSAVSIEQSFGKPL